MAYEVIDNYLEQADYKRFHDSVLRPQMVWYLSPEYLHLDPVEREKQKKGCINLTHFTYGNHEVQSELFMAYNTLYESLEAKAVVQSYVNLYLYSSERVEFPPVENMISFKCKEAIYFCNDSDALVRFNDGTEIQANGNRIILMDENDTYTYISPTNRHYGANLIVKYLT